MDLKEEGIKNQKVWYLFTILLVVAGVILILCSLITVTVTEPYTSLEEVEVIKQESRPKFGRSFGIGFGIKHETFDLLEGETVNIHYNTGIAAIGPPYSVVVFAIIDEANYITEHPTLPVSQWLDWSIAHAEYCCSHGLPGQGDNWNWTVPYTDTWHFVLDFRYAFRDDCYFCITRYYSGTEYQEVVNYRNVPRTLLPRYCLYFGLILVVIGTCVLKITLSRKR